MSPDMPDRPHVPDLPPSARDLFEAAKRDGPSAAAKAKIWSGVATASAGSGAAGAAGNAAIAGTSKLIAAGALAGSALTVGLAVALLRVGSTAPPPPVPPAAPPAAREVAFSSDSRLRAPDPLPAPTPPAPSAPPALAPRLSASSALPPALHTPPVLVKPRARARSDADDALTRESLLVAEARGALVRGDATAALASARAARAVDSHALEPEELSIEARALRVLGREDEAASVEAKLRARYPDHALAR